MLLGCFLIAFFSYQQHYQQLGKKNQVLTRLDQENKANLLQVAAEKQDALAALKHAGAEELLSIARALRDLPTTAQAKEQLQAIQTRLIPIAFRLQGLDTRAQDYLRLKIEKDLPIQQWLGTLEARLAAQGLDKQLIIMRKTSCRQLTVDPEQLTPY